MNRQYPDCLGQINRLKVGNPLSNYTRRSCQFYVVIQQEPTTCDLEGHILHELSPLSPNRPGGGGGFSGSKVGWLYPGLTQNSK